MTAFVTLHHGLVDVLHQRAILGLPAIRNISSSSPIYDRIDEKFIPGTLPQQQINQANKKNKDLTVLQASFNQLKIELKDNWIFIPYLPVLIANN